MRVVCLVENKSSDKSLKPKHGLAFYIETSGHKILFDTGSDSLFLENAKKLGISIADVDTLIISHGHIDHGGALKLFLKENTKAKIYVRQSAFDKHVTKILLLNIDIGLDKNLRNDSRIIFTDEIHKIDDELLLFVSKNSGFDLPDINDDLLMKGNDGYVHDDFHHEQSLIVSRGTKTVLFGGCAHSGVINILNEANTLSNKNIDVMISGFHLYNPVSKKTEDIKYIKDLGAALKQFRTEYHTCHCTGEKAFKVLKKALSENLKYIATGDCLEI